jgi:hypothetical protein
MGKIVPIMLKSVIYGICGICGILIIGHSAFAKAEARLECTNLNRVGGGGPFLVAQISGRKTIELAMLDRYDPALLHYASEDGFEFANVGRIEGRLISSRSHPFAGHQDFLMRLGVKMARLILPSELEAGNLAASRLGGVAPPDANGMIIIETARRHDHADPDTVIWLNCKTVT